MRTFAKRAILLYGGLLLLSAALTVMLLWAFSKPHRPLEYMIAGTLATSVALLPGQAPPDLNGFPSSSWRIGASEKKAEAYARRPAGASCCCFSQRSRPWCSWYNVPNPAQ